MMEIPMAAPMHGYNPMYGVERSHGLPHDLPPFITPWCLPHVVTVGGKPWGKLWVVSYNIVFFQPC